MKLFFQHVGEKGAKRDFPKTIGIQDGGLRSFSLSQISRYLSDVNQFEIASIEAKLKDDTGDGFQIWGIPSGAKSVIRKIEDGDALFLVESATEFGVVPYVGVVKHIFPKDQFALSRHLWGESKFSIIILLKGQMIDYSWRRFCSDFGFSQNWNPAGQTYAIKPERVESGTFHDLNLLYSTFPALKPRQSPTYSFNSLDTEFEFSEGNPRLSKHLAYERSSALIRRFKENLADFSCKICGFDFESTYGAIGKGYIEAHHIEPLHQSKATMSSLDDLIPVCSNCHRMLHREYPGLSIERLKELILRKFTH